jgi:hypothetical protein
MIAWVGWIVDMGTVRRSIGGALACVVAGCGPDIVDAGEQNGTDTTVESTGGAGVEEGADSTGEDVDPFAGEPFGAGARLRPRVLQTAGGGQHLIGFHDDMLGVDCHFFEATDGLTYCMPEPALLPWHVLLGTEHRRFADAACTVPAVDLGELEAGAAQLTTGDMFSAASEHEPCGARALEASPFRLAEGVEGPGYRADGGACEAATSGTLYAIEPVPPTMFVRADLVAAYGVLRLVAEDGAWQAIAAFDDQARPCIAFGRDDPRCVGIPFAVTDDWGECHIGDGTTCEGPRGAVLLPPTPPTCEAMPYNAVSYETLESPTSFHAVVGEAEGVACVVDGECLPGVFGDARSDAPYYEIGAATPFSELPPMLPVRHGEGPLVARHWQRAVGEPRVLVGDWYFSPAGFWEERLQASCWPRDMATEVYCIPNGMREFVDFTHYGDDACRQPLVLAHDDTRLLAQTDPAFVAAWLPEPWTGPVYVLGPEGCAPDTAPSEVDHSPFALGDAIEPASLRLTEIVL